MNLVDPRNLSLPERTLIIFLFVSRPILCIYHLHMPVTSSLLCTNIFCTTLFPNCLTLYSSNIKQQVKLWYYVLKHTFFNEPWGVPQAAPKI
jgi:hypothetical protein